jgi:hypothetical protein
MGPRAGLDAVQKRKLTLQIGIELLSLGLPSRILIMTINYPVSGPPKVSLL